MEVSGLTAGTAARKMEPTSVPMTDPCKFDILPALRGAHNNR
jgi:hypothetical protein